MRNLVGLLVLVAVFIALTGKAAAAQGRPAPVVEGGVGYHGKVDEAFDHFLSVHAGARYFVTPRVAVGPEVTYLRGTRIDRDWVVTGNLTIDLIGGADRRVVPYLVAGAGWATMQTEVGTGPYRSSEFALTAGGGLRIAAGRRFYIAPEFRTGWEPHLRYGVTIGWRLR